MTGMNCDEAKTMLAAYADGELSSLENEAVVGHLEQCGRCRQIVRDQQRVQHVLDSYQPPPVGDDAWEAIGKRLRAELAGKGEQAPLKTRARIEGLDMTPAAGPAVTDDETPAAPRPLRSIPAPVARPRATAARAPMPAMATLRARTRRVRSTFGWVAHVAGAAAAALVVGLGLASLWVHAPPPIEPGALARQGDVAILAIETDANYSLILRAGDTADVITLWVEPDEPTS